ncbi:MAG: sugar phosphate isomerase/epimerase family protein [Armatimonadota bacterium]
MRISILSDEISRDPLTAAELAAQWGLKHLELRGYLRDRAPRGMSDADIEAVARAASTFGLDLPSISPGLFKLELGDPAIADHRGELRRRCLQMARMLGASVMVVFPYVRAARDEPEDRWPLELVADLRETAALAAECGVTVAVENEPICYAATGGSLAKLLDEIDHPNCGANWDPANHFVYHPQDFRRGYEALGERIVHVHVKDHAVDAAGKRSTVPPGRGEVDWPGQVRALRDDGYTGLMVVETHFTPRVAASRACVEALLAILQDMGEAVA